MGWNAGRGAERSVQLRPGDAAVTALGQRVYAAQCVACHGARLEGQPNRRDRGPDGRLSAPPHDASGHTWHHPDELLFRITEHGVARAKNLKDCASVMPAYDGVLSDAEIRRRALVDQGAVAADIRARHDELNRAASR